MNPMSLPVLLSSSRNSSNASVILVKVVPSLNLYKSKNESAFVDMTEVDFAQSKEKYISAF